MSYDQAKELLNKYRDGNCTDDEKILVDKWLFQFNGQNIDLSEEQLSEITEKIWSKLPKKPIRKISIWPRIAAAASILLFLSISNYFVLRHHNLQLAQNQKYDIAPGSNKAILTLSNGQQIVLNNAQNAQLAQQANTIINKKASGQIIYTKSGKEDKAQLVYNTMSTPRGGKFQLTLSDGTQVILNAASSIRYPVNFIGNERRVEITGEAYFEVAHNKAKPFLVISKGQTVQVLGTHFNINAYDDEPDIKTTLLEGSVKLSKQGQNTLLKPGQQAQTNVIGNIKVINNADLEQAVAWKHGMFKFNHADIKTVMRQLSRWYDVDVAYEGPVSDREFSGKLFSNVNASQVLDILSFSKIHYRIENNSKNKKIIVTQ